MVQCAAYNCNVKFGQGKSMFLFPKDVKLSKIWTERLKRQGFQPSAYTNLTKLCERHFASDQFSVNLGLAASLGLSPRQKSLFPNAVPTIFDFTKVSDKEPSSSSATKKRQATDPRPRRSLAQEKRKRKEVLYIL